MLDPSFTRRCLVCCQVELGVCASRPRRDARTCSYPACHRECGCSDRDAEYHVDGVVVTTYSRSHANRRRDARKQGSRNRRHDRHAGRRRSRDCDVSAGKRVEVMADAMKDEGVER